MVPLDEVATSPSESNRALISLSFQSDGAQVDN